MTAPTFSTKLEQRAGGWIAQVRDSRDGDVWWRVPEKGTVETELKAQRLAQAFIDGRMAGFLKSQAAVLARKSARTKKLLTPADSAAKPGGAG